MSADTAWGGPGEQAYLSLMSNIQDSNIKNGSPEPPAGFEYSSIANDEEPGNLKRDLREAVQEHQSHLGSKTQTKRPKKKE